MRYYEVAPTKIVRAGSHTFTYAYEIPLTIGSFVVVPIGKTSHLGIIIKEVVAPTYTTKTISEVLAIPPLPLAFLRTALWMSDYYSTHFATVLQTVLPRGLTKKRRVRTSVKSTNIRDRTHIVFNKDQANAIEQLQHTPSGTVLLHGVTGSGKTAVYIEHAKSILQQGRSVIILVPEIALTSQLVGEFEHHFNDIILTHSKQSEAERHLSWLDAASSQVPRVVIGPRSALFLPLKNIGTIIIDEAHEPSFKQDQAPRYSALRVASILGMHHQATVIQGSATPLVSEFYVAERTDKSILTLPVRARIDASAPVVSVIDMTKKVGFTQHRFLSDALLSTVTQTLDNNKQVLIFHNRRGSASTTLCESCGWSAICPRCFVPFTLHADAHVLRCHICDLRERVPTSCPVCQSTDIIHKGIGTKLIEMELQKRFPGKKIARFDGDTLNTETVESRYRELYNGDIDIIIGTQVIAKGLDLPNLRTVGVIQADAGLSLPDFMASERTFQLLAQVIGRVGRSKQATSVIVQSYQPDATAVRYGITQDYASFYAETIRERQKSKFPPFVYLLKLTCTYKTEAAVVRQARALAAQLKEKYPSVTILGPTPSFYERQRDSYRWQIIIKSTQRAILSQIITNDIPSSHWQYDIDPATLL